MFSSESYSGKATKSAKTQLANYLFVYNTVMWTYTHPSIITPKIFYFPLEETQEAITLRFMSFLLNYLTQGRIRISPTDLRSTDERKPLSQEVLDIMDSLEFSSIMDHYESIVTFYDNRNVTGITKQLYDYARTHGEAHFRTIRIKEQDLDGNVKEVDRKIFDYYTPDDPNEYIMFIVDHVSLLNPEKTDTLRESICKLSEECVKLRNRYNYIPIIIQQQSTETSSLEAFKNNKIRPTVAGLGDAKYTARDCTVMLGICNPNSFELPQYLGYDITKWKGNLRFMEVVLNRNGNANGICPLIFNGAINQFIEAPAPNEAYNLNKAFEKYICSPPHTSPTIALFAWAHKLFNS